MQSELVPVDEVPVEATFAALSANRRAVLIDVRTRSEWTFVGVPDLSAIGKRAILVEWQTFPDQRGKSDFPERLAAELDKTGVTRDDDLYFLCRSGGRSLSAAKAMAAVGYRRCHNASEGFEGPLGPDRKRNLAGWKVSGLPWSQS
ncbi:MAG TPA: rhodanese-like domain-containing protein [Hyphomicrobiaceae bacterium]|nr:rhodanese-like domain-containing protein [Hyphomicrobiaceae bacterium]